MAADVEQPQSEGPRRFDDLAEQAGLKVNVCNDLSGEKFLCETVFAEFCTYCRRSDGNKCVTKKGVKRAEASAPLHMPCAVPAL